MVDDSRWIVDHIKAHENITQREFLEEATRVLRRSDRTIRGHLGQLDGDRIKRVREGREVRLQSIEYWRQGEQRTFDLRVPHTAKLKRVLELFRTQVPIVQELALQTVSSIEYCPDMQLEFESHILFGDLVFHLGLLHLRADPVAAWSEFKKQVSRYIAARDALWDRCDETASKALRLTLERHWIGEVMSEHCVGLFYRHALAAARDEEEREDPFRNADVVATGDAMEYWIGGLGILRRRTKVPQQPQEARTELTAELKRALKLTERPEFTKLADPVVDSANQLRAIREGLLSALEEASYYEVFPGECRFTGAS